MKQYLISILSFLFILCLQGQSSNQMQTAHWYFGFGAGLDFSSGSPVIDTDGQLSQLEGCTSISDENGNLLFYSDGRYVYDQTHNLMQNGSGLHGDSSSTTSAIVLPKPDDCNLYYIFTIDCRDDELPFYRPKRGVEYNIVDMSLNGGLGEVVEKNISLPIDGVVQGYEKMAAISNSDKTGYWIVTHFEGNFYAFAVTADGVDMEPIVSPSNIFGGSQNIGYLKASSNGSKLAMGMYFSFCTDRYLSVYDFNNSTGVVSNEIILHQPGDGELSNYYAVEFSPNSQLLYATNQKPICNNGDYQESVNEIVQYNLMASSVIDSKYIVTEDGYYGALELALDGKIYSNGGDKYIGRIENPNTVYNPSTGQMPIYDPYTIDLNPYPEVFSGMGFPQFLNHYFRIAITVNGLSIREDQLYCSGELLNFDFCHQGGEIESIHWDFGDGSTSTEFYPQYAYNTTGIQTITLTLMVDGEQYVRTFDIIITGPPNIEDALLEACATAGEHTFSLPDAMPQINPNSTGVDITFHQTENDANNNENPLSNSLSVSATTIVYVRAEDSNGCYVVRELELFIYPLPTLDVPTPVETCYGTSASLSVNTAAGNQVYWYGSVNGTVPVFTGLPFETPELTSTTSYWVEAVNEHGCISDRLEVVVNVPVEDMPFFTLSQVYCLDAVADPLPTVSDNGINGSWEPSFVDTSVLGIQTHIFTTQANDCGGSVQVSMSFEVLDISTPEFDLDTEYLLGEAPHPLPTVSGNGILGIWQPATVTNSGTYMFVPYADQCAQPFSIDIKVMKYPLFFTPNGDSYNDTWNISGFEQRHQAKIEIFDRYGKLIKLLDAQGYGWDGTYNGHNMPSDDYWFLIEYRISGQDNELEHKIFRAHFTLKR